MEENQVSNWFSVENALKVYEKYLKLDQVNIIFLMKGLKWTIKKRGTFKLQLGYY